LELENGLMIIKNSKLKQYYGRTNERTRESKEISEEVK